MLARSTRLLGFLYSSGAVLVAATAAHAADAVLPEPEPIEYVARLRCLRRRIFLHSRNGNLHPLQRPGSRRLRRQALRRRAGRRDFGSRNALSRAAGDYRKKRNRIWRTGIALPVQGGRKQRHGNGGPGGGHNDTISAGGRSRFRRRLWSTRRSCRSQASPSVSTTTISSAPAMTDGMSAMPALRARTATMMRCSSSTPTGRTALR